MLFTPIFAVMMIDMVLTIFQQPAKYWLVGFENSREDNMIGRWLLETHPLVFIYAFLIYLIITHLCITHFKPLYRFAAIIGLLIGHVPAAMGRLDTVFEAALLHNIPKGTAIERDLIFTIDMALIIYFSLWMAKTLEKYINGIKKRGIEKT
ncbi:MAG: hypothetical protein AAB617_02570 [Patescibacteria group bacterium]